MAATSSRLEKIGALADCLRRLAQEEIGIAVAFLSGETRQNKLGVAPAAIMQARAAIPTSSPALSLSDVDGALESIAQTSGSGSIAERKRLLADLLARSTAQEQEFLVRLLFGAGCARVRWKA